MAGLYSWPYTASQLLRACSNLIHVPNELRITASTLSTKSFSGLNILQKEISGKKKPFISNSFIYLFFIIFINVGLNANSTPISCHSTIHTQRLNSPMVETKQGRPNWEGLKQAATISLALGVQEINQKDFQTKIIVAII